MKRVPLLIAVLVFVTANVFAANVEISPSSQILSPSAGSFTVTIQIKNSADLGGFQFDIDYDPSVVTFSSVNDAILGDVFQSIATKNVLGPDIDNSSGRITFGAYTYDNPGVNGDATLASVRFAVINPADSWLFLQNVRFADATSGNPISVDSVGNAQILFSTDPVSPTSFSAVFEAGPNGSLAGQTSQTVNQGGSCSAVTAVPNDGYVFSGWTGDYIGTENPLTIENGASGIASVDITFPSGGSGSAVFYRADEAGFYKALDAVAKGEKVMMTVGDGMVTIGVALPVTEDDCFIESVFQ